MNRLLYIIVFAFGYLYSTPPGWEFDVTDNNHSFFIFVESNPNIANQVLEEGDYIGAFYTDLNGVERCAGYNMWKDDGSNLGITVFGDASQNQHNNPNGPNYLINGYQYGEEIIWKLYKSSTGDEFVGTSGYVDPVDFPFLFLTSEGTYVNDGLSLLDKLDANGTTNDKPVISLDTLVTVQGYPFSPINLDQYVTDDSTPDNQIIWSFLESEHYEISINNRILEVVSKDDNWSGSEFVKLYAKDSHGFYGAKYVKISVNENLPPIVADIEGEEISFGSSFTDINLNNFVTDDYTSASNIEWSISGSSNLNVEITFNNVAIITPVDNNWEGFETITFTATDEGGLSDSDDATFRVTSNQAPYVSNFISQTINVGDQFTSINLDEHVIDDSTPDDEISWIVSGNSNLQVSISSNRVATITYPEGWKGSETLTFEAFDSQNLSSSRSATFTVIDQQNMAPILENIPDQDVAPGEEFLTINLDDYVTDDTTSDEDIIWSVSGNSSLIVEITDERVLIVTYPEGFTGNEVLTIRATDKDNISSEDLATYAVLNGGNLPPVVSNIPGETITVGESFSMFDLDDFVEDSNTPDDQIEWTFSGNNQLSVVIDPERRVTITPPSNSWTGSETITFKAKDSEGLYSYDEAIFSVVTPGGNEPPSVSSFPPQIIGQNYTFANLYLDYYVSDDLTPDQNIVWSIEGGVNIEGKITSNREVVFTILNNQFLGSETFTLTATDEGGLTDSNSFTLTIVEGGSGNGPQWGVTNTIVSHTILVYDDAIPVINGNEISGNDYIGVFYQDGDSLRCGGFSRWKNSKSIGIKVFGDILSTPWKEGFDEGEKFKIKVWIADTENSYDVEADYYPIGNGITCTDMFQSGGISRLKSAVNSDSNNRPPHVAGLSSLIIDLGSSFDSINLDQLVCDDYTTDPFINWQFQSEYFNFEVDDERYLTISPKDYYWSGSEIVTFIAKDEEGLTGSMEVALEVVENVENHPGWSYVITSNNHTIMIFNEVFPNIDGIELTNDDYIGVFYDDDGELKCGGYTKWDGENTAVSAWGDEDSQDDIKNGFKAGEVFKWKVWRKVDNKEFDVTARYWSIGGNIVSEDKYMNNGLSKLSQLYGFNGDSPEWTIEVTNIKHSIMVLSGCEATINGNSLDNGDFIGVFYNDSGVDRCSGYLRWYDGLDRLVTIYGDLPETTNKEGFINDEKFKLKIWKNSSSTTYEAKGKFREPGGAITATDRFLSNGVSELLKIYNEGSVNHDIVINYILPDFGGYVYMIEKDSIDFVVSAFDPDNNSLNYEWKLDNSIVSNDSSFFYKTLLGDYGEHKLNVTINDNGKNSLEFNWDIFVDEFNSPPQLITVGDKYVAENDYLIFDVKADDFENDPFEYLIGNGFKSGMNLNPETGRFSWCPNSEQQGVVYLDIIAREIGKGSKIGEISKNNSLIADTTTVKITVYDVVGNIVTTKLFPGWEDSYNVSENDSILFQADCYNKLNHNLFYEWKLNNQVVVSEENSYIFNAGYQSAGTYKVSVRVWDNEYGSEAFSYEWNLIVNNVNRAPEIEKSYPFNGSGEIVSGKLYEFYLDAYDPDNDRLNYKWYLDNCLLESRDEVLNLSLDKGEYSLRVDVSDGFLRSSNEWKLFVVDEILPVKTELVSAYPNPFNPITNIVFTIGESGKYGFYIYNSRGRLVREIKRDLYHQGKHTLSLDFNNLNSGSYFIQMKGENSLSIKKVLLLK